METKYGQLPSNQIHEEKERIQGAIYKFLPYKQEGYELLDRYFDSIIFRLHGLNSLFNEQAEILTIISLLESARVEKDFNRYRKAILDACAEVNKIKEE